MASISAIHCRFEKLRADEQIPEEALNELVSEFSQEVIDRISSVAYRRNLFEKLVNGKFFTNFSSIAYITQTDGTKQNVFLPSGKGFIQDKEKKIPFLYIAYKISTLQLSRSVIQIFVKEKDEWVTYKTSPQFSSKLDRKIFVQRLMNGESLEEGPFKCEAIFIEKDLAYKIPLPEQKKSSQSDTE